MKQRGIPVAMMNGRISDNSYKGYQKAAFFTKRVLPLIDIFCMQSPTDSARVIELGARKTSVHTMDSIKYESVERNHEKEKEAQQYIEQLGWPDDAVILLGASTWKKEELFLASLYKKLRESHSKLRLIIVPRHFERGLEIIDDLKTLHLPIRCKSIKTKASNDPAILLLDTTGELLHFMALADVVFVGKSLFEHGGQNMIEPASLGKAVVVGPHTENFKTVVADLLEAEAIIQAANKKEAGDALTQLIENPERMENLAARAKTEIDKRTGSLDRSIELLRGLIG